MKIAVDFDGTIVEHKYPAIGEELLFAIETLKELQKQQHQLILWTFRSGKELEEAVEYCRQRGIDFYAVNKNYPEEIYDESISHKINADVYIDDRNLGGFPGWSIAFEMITRGRPYQPLIDFQKSEASKRGFINKFRELFSCLFLLCV
jgi:hydroxymethylpyrimidine pyrophosphatase-like HAD family hydrolase